MRATASKYEAHMAKIRKETSSEVIKVLSEGNSAAARRRDVLLPIHRIVVAQKKRKDKASDTLVKLRKVYEEGRRVRVEAHVVE